MTGMQELQGYRGGRLCTVCHHADRRAIDADLTAGESSIRGIAGRWGLAPESVRRHARRHLDADARAAAIALRGIPGLSVLLRLQDVADAARETRLDAEERSDPRTALQAARVEAQVLATLGERFGVRELVARDLAEPLAEAEALVRVVALTARQQPEARSTMADALDAIGHPALAVQVRRQADRPLPILETSPRKATA